MSPVLPSFLHKSFLYRPMIICLTLVACAGFNLQAQQAGQYHNGMVVCATPDAARVGVDILEKGGNAVDAAGAVQFAVEVTHPQAGNIGGGGFMVFRSSAGKTATLDFREIAPAAASVNMFLDSSGKVIPNMSLSTHKASGVPGAVDGMAEAHRKYGHLKWAELVQ